MKNEIVNTLKNFDTATLSDALDSLNIKGALLGIKPQIDKADLCGLAFTVSYRIANSEDKKIKKAANFIDKVPEGFVPILSNQGRNDCTVWGDILTEVAIKRNISGTIIDGLCRDIKFITESKYNMFSKGVFMQSGKGRTVMNEINVPVNIGEVRVLPGDYVRADRNGVVIIPAGNIDEVIDRADKINNTENLIRTSIKKGSSLADARTKYNYNHAWEGEA